MCGALVHDMISDRCKPFTKACDELYNEMVSEEQSDSTDEESETIE